MSLKSLNLKQKTLIQVLIALCIVLLLQFVIPLAYQPFNLIVGPIFGNSTGSVIVVADLGAWFFALAVAWVFYRENSYLNSLMVYSMIPLTVIVLEEFFLYGLFWDYIHLIPFMVNLFILVRKRATLKSNYILLSSLFLTGLLVLLHFLDIAYSATLDVGFLLYLPIYFGVVAGLSYLLPTGRTPKKGYLRLVGKGLLLCGWLLALLLTVIFPFWYLRPSTYNVNQTIVIDSWVAVEEGKHNSNSDLIYWNKTGVMYLVHDRRPFHLGTPDAKILVWNSTDARQWRKVAEFSVPGEDVRDPKFAIIKNRLFLYFLKNKAFPMALPYTTVFTYTEDGIHWAPVQPIAPAGWNFWAPKTLDNKTWYVPAYGRDPYGVRLFNSTDGVNWSSWATLYQGETCSESAIEFLPDGRILFVSRLEGAGAGAFGSANASTLIATSAYPYTDWSSYIKSTVDKLDGLALFSYDNKVFAAARHQPGLRTFFTELGSVFTCKRTSLFLVNETTGLTYITDLPSQGDTAYCGVVLNGTDAFISYYTSNIRYDYPWVFGWFAESDIRIAQVDLTALAGLP